MDHFFATEFYHYFSENPPNVTNNAIFPTQKTLQKVMKITRFELLRGRFTYRDQASRRELKIMQNYSKMQHKSPRNEHEKTWIPVAQCSKTHAVDRPAKLHQNAFAFVVTGVALRTPWMQKSLKIIENLPLNNHKKYECRCCNGQKSTLSIDLRTCIKTRWFLSFPLLLCWRHGCKIRSKSSKIIDGNM